MSRVAKRALDVVLSGAGLLVSAPLWALIAAAIKLDTRGPVFFGQARVGEGGRMFRALKFRSMIADAEQGRRPAAGRAKAIRASRASAACFARRRWTSCRSSGTSSAAT